MWLVFAKKFPFASRAHLFIGIMAYLGSPVWFLFMLLNTWVAFDFRTSQLSQLPFDGIVGKHFNLPGDVQALLLTALVMFLLVSPKIFAYVGVLCLSSERQSFGSVMRLTVSLAFEMILSALLAPSIMVSHTLIVLGMVFGRSVSWGSQNRETDGTGWGEAFRYHAPAVIIGVLWTSVSYMIGLGFLLWMAPILLGLVFAPVVSVLTSRSRYGLAMLNHRILATPEELKPSEVMVLADEAKAAVDPALTANAAHRGGVVAAVVDPYVNGVHVSLLEPETDHAESILTARWLMDGPESLSKTEMAEVMYSAQSMLSMHRSVWSRPFEQLHPAWSRAVESYRLRVEDQVKIGD
jgi:membrane glycosyltransferase